MPLINVEFGIDPSGRLTATPSAASDMTFTKSELAGQTPFIQNFHMAPCPPAELIATGGGTATGPLSADCGPAEVSAGPLWGPWANSEGDAATDAIKKVRALCALQCTGGCADKDSKCVFLATKTSVLEIEARKDPQGGGQDQFRAKAMATGKCQCEGKKKESDAGS